MASPDIPGGDHPTGLKEEAKEQVRNLAEEAKRETSRVANQAGDYVSGLVTRQKDQAADRLGGVAGALRDVGNRLQEQDQATGFGQYATRAADQVDRLSRYLRDRDLNTFFRDTETFARRHPDVFLGGTFLAGLLLARFLKSKSDRGFDGYDANAYASFDEGYVGQRYGRSGFEGDDTNAYASYPGERYGRGNDYQGPQEQARAPMTPIVKLVFGIDYDKTRLTEFAAALSYAERQNVDFGGFQQFVEEADGGLKGLVAAERKARRPDQPGEDKVEAGKSALRAAPTIPLSQLPTNQEFALVLTRRNSDGVHEVVELVVDSAMLDRAIRRAAS